MRIKYIITLVILTALSSLVAQNPQNFRFVKVKCVYQNKTSENGYMPVFNYVVPDSIDIEKGDDLLSYFQSPSVKNYNTLYLKFSSDFYNLDDLGLFFAHEKTKNIDITLLEKIIVKKYYNDLEGSESIPELPENILKKLKKGKIQYRKIPADFYERIYIDTENKFSSREFDFLMNFSPDSSIFQDLVFDKIYYTFKYAFKAATYDSSKVRKNYGLTFLTNRWSHEIDATYTKSNVLSFIPKMLGINIARINQRIDIPQNPFSNKSIEAYRKGLITHKASSLQLQEAILQYIKENDEIPILTFINEDALCKKIDRNLINDIFKNDSYFERISTMNTFLESVSHDLSPSRILHPKFSKIIKQNNVYVLMLPSKNTQK